MFTVQIRVRKTSFNGVGVPYKWKTIEGFSYRTYDDAVKGAERMGVQHNLGDVARIIKVK